jgi:hypothetical protein
MFLKLTSPSTDEKIRININKIVTYVARLDRSQDKGVDSIVGSYITASGDIRIMVRETPEEIDRLLASSYVTIKEAYENRTSEVPQYPTNSEINDSEQLQSGSR